LDRSTNQRRRARSIACGRQTSWLPVYFPLFHPDVSVEAGDTIRAVCTSRLSDNGVNPDYRLQGFLHRQAGAPVRFDHESLHHDAALAANAFIERGLRNRHRWRDDSARLTAVALRAHLEERPILHVPASIVILDELPRAASGKVDRSALPPPDAARAERSRPSKQPRTPSELTLAGIWSRVLNVPDVRVDDNFFQLGGDSILALQIVSRARQANLHFTLEQIFRLPTLADLAAAATGVGAAPWNVNRPPVPRPLRQSNAGSSSSVLRNRTTTTKP